jgi:hypothetical protein
LDIRDFLAALSSCRSASVLVPITHHVICSKPLPVGMGQVTFVVSIKMEISFLVFMTISVLSGMIFSALSSRSTYKLEMRSHKSKYYAMTISVVAFMVIFAMSFIVTFAFMMLFGYYFSNSSCKNPLIII